MPDTRFLERTSSGKWRVTIAVPRDLQKKVGKTRLKRALATDSLITAQALRWPIVAEMKKELERHRSGKPSSPRVKEAWEYRAYLERAKEPHEQEALDNAISLRQEQILGDPIGEHEADPINGEDAGPIYDPDRLREAKVFGGIARGEGTPIASALGLYHGQKDRKARTMTDDTRAVEYLEDWCRQAGTEPFIEKMTRRTAGRFISEYLLGGMKAAPITRRTTNKYISCLSGYWKWLEARGYVEANIWQGQSLPKAKVRDEEKERAFTDEEVAKLLSGKPTKPYLMAMMRIAALTGARIGAIAELRASDVQDGVFRFFPQKRETGVRLVPIHSQLVSTIESLTKGRSGDDPLFPELPPPPPGSPLERSMPAVKLFGRYREKLGVKDPIEGQRRDRVNFHSFRRWFITKAEQANQPESTIAAVVGHKRPGITFGTYSQGPAQEQFRTCVEAVKLPDGAI